MLFKVTTVPLNYCIRLESSIRSDSLAVSRPDGPRNTRTKSVNPDKILRPDNVALLRKTCLQHLRDGNQKTVSTLKTCESPIFILIWKLIAKLSK